MALPDPRHAFFAPLVVLLLTASTLSFASATQAEPGGPVVVQDLSAPFEESGGHCTRGCVYQADAADGTLSLAWAGVNTAGHGSAFVRTTHHLAEPATQITYAVQADVQLLATQATHFTGLIVTVTQGDLKVAQCIKLCSGSFFTQGVNPPAPGLVVLEAPEDDVIPAGELTVTVVLSGSGMSACGVSRTPSPGCDIYGYNPARFQAARVVIQSLEARSELPAEADDDPLQLVEVIAPDFSSAYVYCKGGGASSCSRVVNDDGRFSVSLQGVGSPNEASAEGHGHLRKYYNMRVAATSVTFVWNLTIELDYEQMGMENPGGPSLELSVVPVSYSLGPSVVCLSDCNDGRGPNSIVGTHEVAMRIDPLEGDETLGPVSFNTRLDFRDTVPECTGYWVQPTRPCDEPGPAFEKYGLDIQVHSVTVYVDVAPDPPAKHGKGAK